MEERFIQRLVDGMRRSQASSAGGGPSSTTTTTGLRAAFPPGTVVGGKFQIDRVLGEGLRGLMVAATDLDSGEPVAIKLFRADVGPGGRALFERFTEEAKAAARLDGEHVARVIDLAVTDGGRPYMVIEYLQGRSLDRLLEEKGPLDISDAVECVIQACEGLAEAHARGIVHRDVNPSRLFLAEHPSGARAAVKLLGFGVSKFALSDASNVTANFVRETSRYMAPELRSASGWVDHRADIWSLGATLYTLLAGVAPFKDAPRPPRPLRALRPEIPEALEAVVACCMEEDPDDRYDSTGKLARALLPFAPPSARRPAERAAAVEPALRARRRGVSRIGHWVAAPVRILAAPVSDGRTRRLAIASGLALAVAAFALISSLVSPSTRDRTVVATPAPKAAAAPAPTPTPSVTAPVLEQMAPAAPIAAAPETPPPVEGHRTPVEGARARTPRPRPLPLPAGRAPEPRTESPAEAPVPALHQEVDPSGGREPLRPIEARNPYGTP